MRTGSRLVWALFLLAASSTASAEMAVRRWRATRHGDRVVRFDLSDLPKGARIHGADLLVFRTSPITGIDEEALVPIEIRPLFEEAAAGGEPKGGAKALELRPPWFDRFDATDALRQWARGKPNGGFLVSSCPRWNAEATRLDVAYEGEAKDVPPQVAGLAVAHRAGQTFITWKEIEDPFGDRAVTWGELRQRLATMDKEREVRYRVLRHSRPIDAKSMPQADLLAEVEPLSGFNTHSWSKERLINQVVFGDDDKGELGKYDPFDGWDRDSEPGGRLVIPRFVVAEGRGPLPPGTGLYVHSATKEEKACYAVVTVVDGCANTVAFSPANSLAEPVAESPAPWEPVLQSRGAREFGFDFPGEKLFYVTWVAPPLSNLPTRYFNWSVHLPPEMDGPKPLNVSFHDEGFSYAKPVRRFSRAAIQVAGHDVGPASGWYGYHESLGTLRSWREGKVEPYTERRLAAFIEWAGKEWPVDWERGFADGRGLGATGAAHFACKHPERFAYVLADRGAVCCRDSEHLPTLEAAWGRVGWNLPNDQDVGVWDWQDLTWFVRHKGPAFDLPVLSFSPWGHTAWQEAYPRKLVAERETRWMTSHRHYTRLFKALLEHRHMFFADFDWGPTLGILPQWMDVTLGPVPVATNSTDVKVRESEDGPFIFWEPSGSSPSGWIHWHHRWQGTDAVDRPERLELTVYVDGGNEVKANITLRRARHFRPKPGEELKWTNTCLAEGERSWELRDAWKKYPKKREIQSGTVVVDKDGLVTLEEVAILPTRNRIAVHK